MAGEAPRRGGSASLRTARRADRRLREATRGAVNLAAGMEPPGGDARIEHACLTLKAASSQQVGVRALGRLTGARAAQAGALGDRIRRHALAASATLARADAALTGIEIRGTPFATAAVPATNPDDAALRERYGAELHGFALLLTLGDQSAAARLTGDALKAGALRAVERRHPERTAAWLRRLVLREASQPTLHSGAKATPGGRAALHALRVDASAFAALSALNMRERAAIVSTTIERLPPRDVATIVGLDGARLERLLREGLRRAMSAGAAERRPGPDGPIVRRTREIATRVLA